MALASEALARRTSIRVVLMTELKQAARRPSSPMFNNRLIGLMGGGARRAELGGRSGKMRGMIAGCGRCCSKDTLTGDFSGWGRAVGQWPRRGRNVTNQL